MKNTQINWDKYDNNTFNWYNFSFATSADSHLERGAVYTIEIIIDNYGNCNFEDLKFRENINAKNI